MNSAKKTGAVQSADMARRVEAYGDVCVWYGTCQKCKKALRGSIKELREHVCGTPS